MITLVDLAIDPEDEYHVRTQAAAAVSAIATAEAKAQLKPLAFGLMGADVDDELKGYALEALWPSRLTTSELFAALIPPQNTSLIGAYWMFLHRLTTSLREQLAPSDMPIALTWAASYASVTEHHEFGPLVDAILRRAWEMLDAPGVAEGFARVAFVRLNDHVPIVREKGDSDGSTGGESIDDVAAALRADATRRRILLNAMIDALTAPDCKVEPDDLLFANPPVLMHDDLFWLLGQLDHEEDVRRQGVIGELIAQSAGRGQDAELLDAVLEACEDRPVLWARPQDRLHIWKAEIQHITARQLLVTARSVVYRSEHPVRPSLVRMVT